MWRGPVLSMVFTCAFLAGPVTDGRADDAVPLVTTHDNMNPAGVRQGSVRVIHLVAGEGGWRPEGDSSPALAVAAFGEEGQALSTPGPLIRVAEHTTVVVSVRNTLTRPLFVHGLMAHPATIDTPLAIPPGELRERRFDAGAAGTYHYWGATTSGPIDTRLGSEGQLGGAVVVDRHTTAASDRVFVMTEWSARSDTGQTQRLFAINGRSWPATERLMAHTGREERWRWINLSRTVHPMHLHGFYFTVHAVGTGLRQHDYTRDAAPRSVTEYMPISGTMEIAWTPDRPGNWLFHCHMVSHVSGDQRFWAAESASSSDHSGHDPAHGMAGLVMGIIVSGPEVARVRAGDVRRVALGMYRKAGASPGGDAYAFALGDDVAALGAESATVPGPPLVLTRGQTVEVTIRNVLGEPTAVHWHGIELDSYYDGVPGFSGSGTSITPQIEPGESITVRFTPPRAGTFIYHTHAHDRRQLASGLYGALIVMEPGQAFDPRVDHPIVLGMNAPPDFRQPLDRLPIVINGTREGGLTLTAGVAHRLRFVGITTEVPLFVSVVDGIEPVSWIPLAKDGADLPPAQRASRAAALQMVAPGETYEFILPARSAGTLWLELRGPQGQFLRQAQIVVSP